MSFNVKSKKDFPNFNLVYITVVSGPGAAVYGEENGSEFVASAGKYNL